MSNSPRVAGLGNRSQIFELHQLLAAFTKLFWASSRGEIAAVLIMQRPSRNHRSEKNHARFAEEPRDFRLQGGDLAAGEGCLVLKKG